MSIIASVVLLQLQCERRAGLRLLQSRQLHGRPRSRLPQSVRSSSAPRHTGTGRSVEQRHLEAGDVTRYLCLDSYTPTHNSLLGVGIFRSWRTSGKASSEPSTSICSSGRESHPRTATSRFKADDKPNTSTRCVEQTNFTCVRLPLHHCRLAAEPHRRAHAHSQPSARFLSRPPHAESGG